MDYWLNECGIEIKNLNRKQYDFQLRFYVFKGAYLPINHFRIRSSVTLAHKGYLGGGVFYLL